MIATRHSILTVLLVSTTLAVTACAGTASPGVDSVVPDPAPDDVAVVGQGTVIQVGDAAPEFCLGAIAESYPPQCGGPELIGWDWDTAQGFEEANDVRWGAYAVWGDWDGTSLAVTSSIMLALYDPMPFIDPALDPANAGTTSEADLLTLQEQVTVESPMPVLISAPQNGYLFVTVVFDDGSVQAWADTLRGPGVVQVRSALTPIEG